MKTHFATPYDVSMICDRRGRQVIFALYPIHTHRHFKALLTNHNNRNEIIKIVTRVWVGVWVGTKLLVCSESWSIGEFHSVIYSDHS